MQPLVRDDYTGGVQLLLVDYPDDIELLGGPVGSTGTISLQTDPVDQGFIWRAERLTTYVSASNAGPNIDTPAGSAVNVYKGVTSPVPIKFRDGSSSPGLDVADESNPITVQQGLFLFFYWTGLAPGSYVGASIQYSLYRRLITGTG
jgi:hypothetical protein